MLSDLLRLMALGAAAVVVLMTGTWAVSVRLRDASIVDVVWGPGFVVLSAIALAAGGGSFARRSLVFALVAIWGVRLAIHIGRRKRGEGEDRRYRAFRERWGERFWWVSLFTVFLLQAGIMLIVAQPIFAAGAGRTPSELGPTDLLGAAVWLVGFVFETVGDAQLARHRRDPRNRNTVLDRGLWRYTRHPNYFGDALVWWGLGLVAVRTPYGTWALIGPALMTFLLVRVSGVKLLERDIAQRRPDYAEYVRRTSAFFPMPPKRSTRPPATS